MAPSSDDYQRTSALRRAAVRATFAPSVHNTQPWRFELRAGELDIFADPSRQLSVLDPTRRQLVISCGCALFNARVSLASTGFGVHIERLPDAGQPDLLARITLTDSTDGYLEPIGALDAVLQSRQTNRRQFSDDEVPAELINVLERAAAEEDGALYVLRSEQDRSAVASLCQRADGIQNVDPAYRAEIRAWTSDEAGRLDGVPAMAVPHVDGHSEDELPIRDFDSRGRGWLPAHTRSSRHQCLVLLGTRSDHPDAWLRAGEALERMLLEITRHGFAASPLTQVIEVASTRATLRDQLGLAMYPHILLRVGRAPLTPASRRRRLVDVLSDFSHLRLDQQV